MERERQEQNARDVDELPRYIEVLEEWHTELKMLEIDPAKNPDRLAELIENIPKLEEEIKFRKELKEKQK